MKRTIQIQNKVTQKQVYKEGIEFQFVKPLEYGPIVSYSLLHDPVHMAFVLARYKFVARMLTGKTEVLEIGCGDGFGTPIVAEFVGHLDAFEVDKRYVESNRKRLSGIKNIYFSVHNICERVPAKIYDAIYSVDVIEHLDKHLTKLYIENALQGLNKDGVYIVGTPNITANQYASKQSKIQHINLFSGDTLKELLQGYFANVFMFSMNDEVVHTGFLPMAHYLWAVGVGKKT